jgi:hypothetical protein
VLVRRSQNSHRDKPARWWICHSTC